MLVEADTESLADLAASVNEAVALGAGEVSNSYGAPEHEMGPTEQAAYDHPGIVIAASSGDTGYLDWDDIASLVTPPETPNAPASLPSVVAVGGTSLELKASGARKSEAVWNDSGPPSGSGFKQFSATVSDRWRKPPGIDLLAPQDWPSHTDSSNPCEFCRHDPRS